MITQGKWELITSTGDIVVKDETGQTRICNMIEHAPKYIDEDMSNAALIAAAPELLAACKSALQAATIKLDTYAKSAEKQAEVVSQL